MALYARKTSILAKIETVYGTDPVPTGAANAMLCSNVALSPLEMDLVDRNLYRPYLGGSAQLLVGQRVMLSFDIEIAGAGTSAVTKAKYDPLLRACGFSSTVVSTTHVAYAPVSAGFESVTLHTFIDGILHVITGAMGTVDLELSEKKIPVYKFKFTGMYNAPTDDVNPTTVFTSWQIPLGVNNTNSSAFEIHGYQGILQSLTISLNNSVVHRNWVGLEEISITQRAPTGQISMQLPDELADKDWFAVGIAQTLGNLELTHGTEAFNTFKLVCGDTVQILKPTYGEADGIRTLQAQLQFVPTGAGNDELIFHTL